jgi:hypothetical protein
MMMAWTAIILFACLAPIAIWLFDRSRSPGQRDGRHTAHHDPSDSADLDLASEKA